MKFNRAALIQSQSQLAHSGYFKPDTIVINPIIDERSVSGEGLAVVDIQFEVTEL